MPSDDKLREQSYRSRFFSFIRLQLETVGRRRGRHEWGTEEVMLNIYPKLRDKWIVNKLLLDSIEPTIDVLKRRWIQNKKHDCNEKT
jgi:hypothetical protein